MRTEYFDYQFRFAGQVDIGKSRKSNQDEILVNPELGFFGVSDGMGGLENGAAASAFVKKGLPLLLTKCSENWDKTQTTAEEAGSDLKDCTAALSDHLFTEGNTERFFSFGATLAGVLLFGDNAIFVGLGDSRGYVLRKHKRKPVQITRDMNLAGIMVQAGEMTKEEAGRSPLSSKLTAFVGMTAPATPEIYVTEVVPGDRILLCSDGLYSMVPEGTIARILRSSKSPERVCRRLVDKANENGGRDNISAVYIKIE